MLLAKNIYDSDSLTIFNKNGPGDGTPTALKLSVYQFINFIFYL